METKTKVVDEKSLAIIAYLSIIGLAIALIMNREKKDEFAAYHIQQSLGLCLCGIVLGVVGLVPLLGWIISFFGSFFLLYLWISGLFNALSGRFKNVPVLGKKFQQWFKTR